MRLSWQVITMLKGLAATAEEEGKAEAVAYDQFEHWCVGTRFFWRLPLSESSYICKHMQLIYVIYNWEVGLPA